MFIQRVICDSFWGRMAAVWATTHKVWVENGLKIPENTRRDDDSDPKDFFCTLKSGPCSMQAVVCDGLLGHMAAFLATTHKVCVEDGLRIPEDSRRDDDSYPKTIHLFILKSAP